MENIDQALLNYDDLPASERAAVDGYLAEHPEAQATLAEGRALRALLHDAAEAEAAVPDAESLALYLATRSASSRPLPPELEALSTRIEDAFGEHPELERRYAMMQDRLKRLTTEAEAPLAQFERLTGRRLGHVEAPDPLDDVARDAAAPAPESRRVRQAWRASVADRAAAPLLRRVSLPRLALAASLAVALLYGSLLLASRSSTTRWERLAGLGEVPAEFEGLRLRGVGGQTDPVADRYAEALQTLHEARSTTLGLFPSYDPDGLRRSVALLEEATALGEPDGPIVLEAWFLLGKIRLYEGDEEAARTAFQVVADRGGPSAPDARRLLAELAPPAAPR